ncbi:hypothetical protein GCM10027186_16550 [Micromonospora schwarzwaldensis]
MVSRAHDTKPEPLSEKQAGTPVLMRAGDGPPASENRGGWRVTTRRKGLSGPKKYRPTNANRWREVAEWAALILKVLTYAAALAVTLAGGGCGPN